VSRRLLAAVALTIVGGLLRVPVAASLGLIAVGVEAIHELWARRALDGLTYVRRIGRDHLEWGEETDLAIEVWNRKRLPLAWLRADDAASPGVVVRERPIIETRAFGTTLRNTWSLAGYERVVRHLRVTADARGVFALGPTTIVAADLFARQAATDDLPAVDRFLVRPRALPMAYVSRPERLGDLDRARRGLAEDPSRFAGLRPYSPGDPLRRIHARASQRLGQPLSKRFEPSRERDVLIALDLQVPGRARGLVDRDDDVEALIVIAASIARGLATEGAGFGLTAAGYSGRQTRFAEVPVSGAAGQADRVLDLLARLSPIPSARFETLLTRIGGRATAPATLLVLSARDPRPFFGALRRLGRAGLGVVVVCAGEAAAADAAAARGAGFGARMATLDGPWREATRVRIA